jgi:hypothetical protein
MVDWYQLILMMGTDDNKQNGCWYQRILKNREKAQSGGDKKSHGMEGSSRGQRTLCLCLCL